MKDSEIKEQLLVKKELLEKQIGILQSNVAAIKSAILVFDNKAPKPTENERLREMIFTAIKQAPPEFSIRDIERNIAIQCSPDTLPKVSIASSFWKIANEELKLPIVQKGEGRRPTIYGKISAGGAGKTGSVKVP
jgi:DNA-directed RNA polymerase specialized sigma54-like protein